MKKFVFALILLVLVLPAPISALGQDDIMDRILELYPNVTKEQLASDIEYASSVTKQSSDAIARQMYEELSLKVPEPQEGIYSADKGSGVYPLASSSKGDVFFETASTAGIPHGHVGIYYTPDYIVESVPSTGVRKVKLIDKRVDKGSKIITLKKEHASTTARAQAADWANGRLGEDYSYNFATNRLTSCTGDKNCSKLVWCAFKEKANIDIDLDGGLGVYPVDIRDSSLFVTLKSY
ncbi:hypothetical protein LQV63_28220 [Paenibacillus profundus]|uniref:YycO n=2 Tax=Paenibacillus profundus TaxID=1173085 RepID=A0ABS8YRV4_9BACL|nr:YiiX/YebB-like N1pC/P60 family cysteine hydrolase [Paenibacillus sp. OSY-SE]MCE5173153.1 hypothetical protein [Paenibacillus profundus]